MKNMIIKRITLLLMCTIFVLGTFGCSEKSEGHTEQTSATETTAESASTTPIINVQFKTKQMTLASKATAFLNVSIVPEEYSNNIEWSSSNEKVATVDDAGRVDAISIGKTTITAKVHNSFETCEIKVEASNDTTLSTFSTAYTSNQSILEENLKNSEEKLPYFIRVNRIKNCVTVYTYDAKKEYSVPVRAMVCSTGTDNSTVKGLFSIGEKYQWLHLYGDVYGQYASGFHGDFLFHSVPYLEPSKDTLQEKEYNKLGQSASLGCVRLAVADAKWIYDNCGAGTVVDIYDDITDAGPLGIPSSIKINESLKWDPTDSDSENPYNKKKPIILGAENITLPFGKSFDEKDGITAVDTCGNDITDSIEVIGIINKKKSGIYRFTYRVTDSINRTTTVDRYVTVAPKEENSTQQTHISSIP